MSINIILCTLPTGTTQKCTKFLKINIARILFLWYHHIRGLKTNAHRRWTVVVNEEGKRYYLVESGALPPILSKVIQAKEMLETGQAETVGEAAQLVGISRSAFYKYRDAVSPFVESVSSRVITFHVLLRNQTGVLSALLLIFARYGANILTINQSIPVSGRAVVTIAAEMRNMESSIQALMDAVGAERGIIRIEAIAG